MALISRPRRRGPATWYLDDPLTRALGVLAIVGTGGVVAGEIARVWRRGSAPMPHEADDVLAAAGEAIEQTVEVAVRGFRVAPFRENAALTLLVSFNTFWLMTRMTTARIRHRGRFGPFRDARFGKTHVHHFVPGIALMMLAGGTSIASANERLDPLLAIPFGYGAALTLDESALLLRLEDVYWSDEGMLSVQVALATSAVVSAIALATRTLRRGEAEVLEPVGGSD
jgi:hypothetical protein